jgi:hypothetical protein
MFYQHRTLFYHLALKLAHMGNYFLHLDFIMAYLGTNSKSLFLVWQTWEPVWRSLFSFRHR